MTQVELCDRIQPDVTTSSPLPSTFAPAHRTPDSVSASERRFPLGTRFWRLFGANAVSAVGDGMVLVAFPLLALTLTTSPVLIAGVAIAGRLPALCFSIPVGALVDRVDRRRLVVLINVVRIVVLSVFAGAVLAGHDSLLALYGTVFVLGT